MINLKELMEASIDPKLVARSKESGKLVYFKTPQAKDAALKKGTHEDPKAKKADTPNVDAKPNSMYGGDYAKDRGDKKDKEQKKAFKDLGIERDIAINAHLDASEYAKKIGKKSSIIGIDFTMDMIKMLRKAKISDIDDNTAELLSKIQTIKGETVADAKTGKVSYFLYDGSKYEMNIDIKNKSVTTKELKSIHQK
jgi:hypothetical protein